MCDLDLLKKSISEDAKVALMNNLGSQNFERPKPNQPLVYIGDNASVASIANNTVSSWASKRFGPKFSANWVQTQRDNNRTLIDVRIPEILDLALNVKYGGTSLQTANNILKGLDEDDSEISLSGYVKPGVQELFNSNPELANQVYEALGFKRVVTQDDKSYYRGQIEEPTIDKDGNLVLYAREDELYKRAGLKSKGISMTDDLQSAIEYGNGQLQVAQNLASESYDANQELERLSENGYYLIQIPKNASNEIVKEAGEVKVIGERIIIPKGQYKIEQVVDGVEQITPQQKQQALQLYSAYLDTIFPDSKVKDIVYHGVTKGREAYNNILQNGFLTTNKSNWSNDKDKEFKGVFFTDIITATSYGVNLERELRPEEKDFVIPAILNVETLLTPKMGLVSGTVTKLRNENLDIQNLGVQGEEGSEGVHENTVVFEPEQIHILGGKQDIEGFKEFVNQSTRPQLDNISALFNTFVNISNEEVLELLNQCN